MTNASIDQAVTERGAPKPDHVPAELVYDFDYIKSDEYLRDPYATANMVAVEAPPIFWTPRNRGHWVIASYEAASAAAKDWETFSSQIIPKEVIAAMMANMPEGTVSPITAIPANMDPPEHSAHREPISVAFSPKVAAGLKEEVRDLAVELIEKIRPAGQCELMSEVTEILPIQMFLKLFGLPLEKQNEYRDVVMSVSGGTSMQDFEGIMRNTMRLVNAFTGTIVERRDNPHDDLISVLWKTEVNGKPMTLDIMQRFCLTLFLAGLDTVTNAMALGTRHLAGDPQLQAELRADPRKIPMAAEELLRLYTISLPIRTVARDGEFNGVTMKKGEQVHLYHIAADRDPAHFEDPDSFSLERKAKAHLAFGTGPHRCLGMHLARVELHVYYEELLKRLPTFRLDPDRPTTFHGGITMGPNEVHLMWDKQDRSN